MQLKVIDRQAWRHYHSLAIVKVPSSVVAVEYAAFLACHALTLVAMPAVSSWRPDFLSPEDLVASLEPAKGLLLSIEGKTCGRFQPNEGDVGVPPAA